LFTTHRLCSVRAKAKTCRKPFPNARQPGTLAIRAMPLLLRELGWERVINIEAVQDFLNRLVYEKIIWAFHGA
jgi:hypothetical protein